MYLFDDHFKSLVEQASDLYHRKQQIEQEYKKLQQQIKEQAAKFETFPVEIGDARINQKRGFLANLRISPQEAKELKKLGPKFSQFFKEEVCLVPTETLKEMYRSNDLRSNLTDQDWDLLKKFLEFKKPTIAISFKNS